MSFDFSNSGFVTNADQFAAWDDWIRSATQVRKSRKRKCVAFAFSRRIPDDRYTTRIGGLPAWPANEPWPDCSQCGEPLAFVVQFDFRRTPLHITVPGDVLVFHYCFDCGPWESLSPGSRLTWCRVVPDDRLIQARIIPDSLEDDDPGPCYGSAHACFDYYSPALTLHATKIGGYPIPIQTPAPPRDSRGRKTTFVAAIGGLSHHDVPKLRKPTEAVGDLVWYDAGCINIWMSERRGKMRMHWNLDCY